MFGDVGGDQFVLDRADGRSPRREQLEQLLGDAGQVPAGVAVSATVASLPGEPEGAGEVVGQHGSVVLRQCHHRRMDRPAIQGPPLAIEGGLDLVGDHDMGVQLGIARTGVDVIEGDCADAGDVDLGNCPIPGIRAHPGGGDLGLEQPQDVVDGGVVGSDDLGLHLGGGEGPQDRHRLGDREGQVVSGDCATGRSGGLCRLDRGHGRGPLLTIQPRIEPGDPSRHSLRTRQVPGVGTTQRVAGDRVATLAQQQCQLRLLHHIPRPDAAVPEACQAAAEPPSGRSTVRGVVRRQRQPGLTLPITDSDRRRQVPVAMPSGHHPHRHRHPLHPQHADRPGRAAHSPPRTARRVSGVTGPRGCLCQGSWKTFGRCDGSRFRRGWRRFLTQHGRCLRRSSRWRHGCRRRLRRRGAQGARGRQRRPSVRTIAIRSCARRRPRQFLVGARLTGAAPRTSRTTCARSSTGPHRSRRPNESCSPTSCSAMTMQAQRALPPDA